MNRTAFGVIAAVVAIFLGWAVIAGNRLPAELRTQIQSEQSQLDSAKKTIADERSTVSTDAAADPELFQVRGFDREWPARFTEAGTALGEADRYAATLEQLRRRNSRSTRAEVQDLIARERDRRTAALSDGATALKEAQKRIDLKHNFAQTLTGIESRAKQFETADYSSVVPKVEKAEADWPSRKEDLQTRLNALLAPKKEAVQWEQSARVLEARNAADLKSDDYAKALDLEESIDHAPGAAQAQELDHLSHQLYTSWDNILEDLDKDHDLYREKLKHVVTTVPAPSVKGSTVSENLWKQVPPDQWHLVENDVGMTIAHKPLGEYDTEANHTPQPAGFAYMASPTEGRNQYGYWDNRGGSSVWTWLPEYLILSSLLSNHGYQPVPYYEWNRYSQAQRYGQTYYGRDNSGVPKYGSHGTFTAQHYGSSRYVQTGGFSGSKYGSGGGFSGSKYGSGNSAGSSASSSAGHRFGSSSDSAPHKFGGSSSGMRFGSGSRSSGRSFGGRRR